MLPAALRADVEVPALGGSAATADGPEDPLLAMGQGRVAFQFWKVASYEIRDVEPGSWDGHPLRRQALQRASHRGNLAC